MPTIDQHLGMTVRVGPVESNQYARVDVTVRDINTDLPIEPQLDSAKIAVSAVWPFVLKAIDLEITKIQAMTNPKLEKDNGS